MKNVEDLYPLTPLQKGMLFHTLLAPESAVYVSQLTCTLPADLDAERFRQAWETLVRRHGVLRTAFLWEGLDEPLQAVRKTVSVPWQELDWRGLPEDEQERRFADLCHRERHTPFSLARAPLLRFSLIHLGRRTGFVWTLHHLLLDGWSLPLLVRELTIVYTALLEGREPALPPVRPFGDYVVWLKKQDPARAEPFWRGELAGFTAPNALGILGIDRPARAHGASGYAEHGLQISREATARLQTLASQHKLTLQTVTLGAWAVLVSRYSGDEDVVFGNVVSGRPAALPGVETMVGMFINTLPVRARVNGAELLAPWLQRLQERQLARQEFEQAPLAEIQRWSEVPAGSPLFETLYVFENYPNAGAGGSNSLQIGDLRSFESTNYPFTLTLTAADHVSLRLAYDRARMDENSALRLLGHLGRLLAGIGERAEQALRDLPLLSEAELHQLRAEWIDTASFFPQEATLHSLFAGQAEQRPEAVAVEQGEEGLTFRELGRRAERLARRLLALGLRPEERVGVLAERSPDLIAALLGILQAGGAYLPLDPTYPPERLSWMIADAGASLLVALPSAPAMELPAGLRAVRLDGPAPALGLPQVPLPQVPAESLAYVMYTSGSTGAPKGVAVTHRNVVRLVRGAGYAAMGPEQTWLQYAPVSFDASTLEIWAPLLNGGRLVMFPGRTGSVDDLARVVESHGVTSAWLTAGLFHEMVDGCLEGLKPLRQLLTGGDVVSAEHARRALAAHPGLTLIDGYGPTEGTTFTSCHVLSDPHQVGESVPIGRPIANARTWVVDRSFALVPIGVWGELCVGGDGLARGYLDRPYLTAERFVPDPFGTVRGERLYRTGDLVRWRTEGILEFSGRIDHQVKLRGFRIEPGEIEAALVALPGVREAVVVAREDVPGDRRLVAYMVGDVPVEELRRSLRGQLPGFMMPSAFVTLAALPLTPNGKVDRKALLSPGAAPEPQSSGESYVAPRTPVEEVLAGIWAEVLGRERVGVADSFFGLGGHSLLATQVTSRLRKAFGVELPLRDLFETAMLAELATRVEVALRAGAGALAPPLAAAPRQGPQPLSFAQQRLWFIDRLEPGGALYNIPVVLSVEGPLRVETLRLTLGEIVRRHEALRTVFAVLEGWEGSPVQVVQPAAPFALPVVDLSGLPESRRETAASALAGEEAGRPFDLGDPRGGPLLRCLLLRLAPPGEPDDHVLALTLHHIAGDGWSMGILVREVAVLYAAFAEGQPSPLPELPVQYADFAVWQRSWLQGEVLSREIAYWKQHLAGLPPLLELPTDRPRPAVQSFHGAGRPVRLPAGLTRQLEALARREGATLFMVLLAGFEVLLARISGQEDLAVGSPIAGRNRVEIEGLIGFFVNTLVMHGRLTGGPSFRSFRSFRELLGQVRETALAAYVHQDVPFEKLVEELAPERSLARSPLFQVMFALQNAPVESLEIRGLRLRPLSGVGATVKFDLELDLQEQDGGLSGMVGYATDLFDGVTIDRLIGHFERTLAAALATPELPVTALLLLTGAERHQLLVEWNDTETRSLAGCLHHDVAAQAARTPAAVAVEMGIERWTYRRLIGSARRLARHLRVLGIGPDVVVGLCVERSPAMVVGMLAVLEAGGAWLPLDPGYPAERQAFMLKDSGAQVLLIQKHLMERVPAAGLPVVLLDERWDCGEEMGEALGVEVSPDHLAYVIYTSGSTGQPKGVMVPHRGVCNRLRWAKQVYGLDERDAFLHKAASSVDVAVWECFAPLVAGARLVLAEPGRQGESAYLIRTIREHRVTLVDFVPSMLAVFLDETEVETCVSLRQVFVGGEALSPELRDRMVARLPVPLDNMYGPTEITIDTTRWVCAPGPSPHRVPIGRPIGNSRLYVVDRALRPLPLGVSGELVVGGEGVTRGYLGRPGLSAERFVPDPFGGRPGGRLYRTGDLARCRDDGAIEFLGRLDHQVKIRGVRIELGEIEAVLRLHPVVHDAVADVRSASAFELLTAWVVPREGSAIPAAADLRAFLRERLPDYMVPAAFVALAALPLTPGGKVDRKALPAPGRPGSGDLFVAPRTPVEELLAAIWSDVLGVERVGVADSFFDLGGHSLLATQLMSRLRRTFGVEMPLRDLFAAPRLADLAVRVEAALAAGTLQGAPPLVRIAPALRRGPQPLSFAQQRLWFIDQLEPGSALYNMPEALRVEGPLRVEVLRLTLGEIVRRHEALRTVFAVSEGWEDSPVQVVQPAAPFLLPVVDLSGLPESRRETVASALAGEEAGRPFDLTRDLMLHCLVLRIAEDDHAVLLTMHHIASDGWSTGILVREVAALYAALAGLAGDMAGRPSPLPELPVQYADFAVWQRSWLQGEALERELAYWRRELAGLPPLLELSTDRPRPAVQSYRGAIRPLRLPAGLTGKLEALARREGATLFMVLLAGFEVLLARTSGQEDLAVGSPIAGRNRVETEGLIGFFVNTLVMRGHLTGGTSFRELLGRVRETALAAYVHQDVPFEKLVEELAPERSLAHAPLFQVMLVLQNAPMESLEVRDLRLRPVDILATTAKFDLTVSLEEHAGELAGFLEYSTSLFDGTTVDRLGGHLERLLAAAVSTPAEPAFALPLTSPEEQAQILVEWNDTAAASPSRWVYDLFASQVLRTPEAIAVVFGDEEMTYAGLAARAGRLARRLQRLGVGPDVPVGLLAARSLDMITGVLGILQAGGAYVPLDPAYPVQRLAFMLGDTRTRVLLTQTHLRDLLPLESAEALLLDGDEDDRVAGGSVRSGGEPGGDNLGYVIYTSGSTGRPKGVALSQLALRNLIDWHLATLLGGVRTLQFASLSFDASFHEMFACWGSGGTLVVVPEDLRRDMAGLAGLLVEQRIEKSILPVVVLQQLAEIFAGREDLPPLREITTTGERLQTNRGMAALLPRLPGCAFHNHYGPSETHVATAFTLSAEPEDWEVYPSIGRPIGNSTAYVLERGLVAAPIGVPGDLYLGGACLARGYLGRPDLTAERFVPDSLGVEPGARLYRTGDKVRLRTDGNLEYVGRFDDQVKIRGFRIEPGEIEALLMTLPGVDEAVVVVREDRAGDRRLVAYVVGEAGADGLRRFLREKLREKLRESLPDYMVPSAFVVLPELPLTPNGKVDRKALPAPEWQGGEESYVAPRTPVEEILAGIWAEVLGRDRVGVADSFFDLGGHSLLATQVMSRLRRTFGVEMPLRDLFASPRLADLAVRVEAALAAGTLQAAPPLVRIAPALRQGPQPLSFAQQRLWFIDRLEPGSTLYNMPVVLRVEGPLDPGVLARTLGEIVRRHEALRTVFSVSEGLEGSPVQGVRPAAPFELPVMDLSGLPESRRETAATALAGEEAGRPFDLGGPGGGALLRGLLLRLTPPGEPEDYVLALTMHHIASDGWSMGILVREVVALYAAFAEGLPSPLPELPVQYADFAVWQRSWLQGEVLEREIAYWKQHLAGLPPLLELPTDWPRPAVQSYRGATRPVRLPAGLTGQLEALARREGATLFMVLLAGFQALLARTSGQDDLAVGSPLAGRNRVEIEGLIGFFVNTLVLRGDLSREPAFRELLGRVRETALAAHAHQDLPFERLVEELAPERSLARSPLFQVMFALQNAPVESLEIRGLQLRPVSGVAATVKFDLELDLQEQDGGLSGMVGYATDLFDGATIDRLIGHFERTLAAALATPELPVAALLLLTGTERHQLLVEWNDTETRSLAGCLHHDVAAQAARTPAAVAVEMGIERWTYRRLIGSARRLARHLRVLGIGPDVVVGLCVERSPAMVVGMLAVLEAGGAWLPLDPGYPAERLAFMLEDSGAQVLLIQESLRERIPAAGLPVVLLDGRWDSGEGSGEGSGEETGAALGVAVSPDNLAYVIYTSGSTGKPKGVMVPHRGVCNRLRWAQQVYRLGPDDAVLQKASFGFDFSVWECFAPLSAGARLVLAEPGRQGDGPYLVRVLRDHRVTFVHFVPSMLAVFLAEDGVETCGSLRQVFAGGEALTAELRDRALTRLPAPLDNQYGPTEISIDTTRWVCAPGQDSHRVPIGRPIANSRLYAVDPELQPVPIGVTGELLVGGAGVTRGYLRRPGLTAERYVPDPFSGQPGGRLYRTGDLVRRLPGGSLDFQSRLDHQVKIRGLRIELGEIEAALLTLPGVREAVVAVREDPSAGGSGDRRPVAYVAGEVTAGELRRSLRERLPDHMVPSAFVLLAALPLTPSGKVDRKALPAPERQSSPETGLAPRTPVEEILAGIWAEVLGVERVGVADSFFDLGGHSLLATRVMSRLRRAFGVEMPLRDLFASPRLADLAVRVETALAAAGTPQAAPPLVRIAPALRQGPQPLSFAQQRLWFIDQLEPGSPLYNIPVALRVEGPLRAEALRLTLGEIVRRHEALRTVFAVSEGWEGSPVQVVQPAAPFALPLVDLSGLPESRRETAATALAGEEAGRPFDLTRDLMLHCVLLRIAEDDHAVLLTMHHIASDGWSTGILVREVAALYAAFASGRPSPLPELPVQYADFAVWQRSWLQGEALERELAYWRRELAGLPPLLELPTDRPRPAVQSYRGAIRPLRLPAGLTGKLEALARREGATLFMVLLAGFEVLLTRTSGQEDLAVGSPIAGRNRVETEGLIGFFVNTLVMRGHLTGGPSFRSFRELLAQVRETALAAYLHQDLPFEKLVEELAPERSLAQAPLFQVMLVLQNAPTESLEVRDLLLRPMDVLATTSKFDLTVSLEEHGGELAGFLEYSTSLFDGTTVDRLGGHLERLLAAAVSTPAEPAFALPLTSPEERAQILAEWNDTAAASPSRWVYDLFASQVLRTPETVAVVFGDEELTYAELAARAGRLARRLQRLGVGPDVPVGLLAARSLDMITGVLGILQAGGAYVPLDPAYPVQRLAFMLGDTRTRVLLTQTHLRDLLPLESAQALLLDGDEDDRVAGGSVRSGGEPGGDNLGYVIYTSGSTGRPKGVALSQLALRNLIDWHLATLLGGARTLQFASLSFDASFHEMFACWGSGGTLVVVPEDLRRDMAGLADLLVEQRIEKSILPVVVLQQLAEIFAGREDLPPLREITTTGERLQTNRGMAALLPRLPGCAFHNHYGPSETHVATAFTLSVEPEDWEVYPSIGRPIGNSTAYVLERGLVAAPIGVPGDLYLGGACLARGYLGRPDLTAERFVPDSLGVEPGARLYRTGDKVRLRTDGNLEYVGRFDDQVKIRGFRIEPGEIEALLMTLPGVDEAVVVVREDRAGDRRLVAYVVGEAGADGLRRSLREKLRESLPDYMVPSAFVVLPELPLTPNGKVDRKALPAPEWQGGEESYVAPRTPVEEILAGIWAEVLGRDRVGVADSFFDLGGHSLLATQVMSRLRRTFGVEMPLRDLFASPRLADLAVRVEAALAAGTLQAAPPLVRIAPALRQGPQPLSFAQQRLWFIDRLEPGSTLYNMPVALRVEGPLDPVVLARTLGEIVCRHEALRTVFAVLEGLEGSEGSPVQVVRPAVPFELPVMDLSGLPESRRETAVTALAGEEAGRPFDLGDPRGGPLLRGLLLRLAPPGEPADHAVLLTMHHIASDGWSMGILVREVAALYAALAGLAGDAAGLPSSQPELPVQYADFAVWQRSWLQGEVLEREIAYWKQHLAGLPPLLELPTDRPRPAVQSYRGAARPMSLPAGLTGQLEALARREGATLFMVLLAGFQALLARTSGQDELAVGSPLAGRNRVEIEGLIGFFVNTLVLRGDLSREPVFRELLGGVRETALGAHAHQDLPFEKLVEELAPERSLAHSPLFQVMLALQNAPAASLEIRDLRLRQIALEATAAKFDLTLSLEERDGELTGMAEYATDLYDGTTVGRLMDQFERLLAAVVEAPAVCVFDLPLLSESERRTILVEWSSSGWQWEPSAAVRIDELFARQAARTPGKIAAVCQGKTLTYGQLDEQASRLARLLYLDRGDRGLAGLMAAPDLPLLVGMLGILKAGCGFVPLDPDLPAGRLERMAADCILTAVVADRRNFDRAQEIARRCPGAEHVLCLDDLDDLDGLDRAPESLSPADVGSGDGSGDGIAYVIFTSGSTGIPKGVPITHDNLVPLLLWSRDVFGFGEHTRVRQSLSYAFDFGVFEILTTLLFGGTLVLSGDAERGDVEGYLREVREHGVNTLHTTPSFFRAVAAAAQERLPLQVLHLGGEALSEDLVEKAFAATGPECRLFNGYGPTEASVNCALHEVVRAVGRRPRELASVPIGRPSAGSRLYVLDSRQQPVPIGVGGELLVGGASLSLGYLGRPDLTAERFVPDLFATEAGARLYRTGDLVRWTAAGDLEFLGRTDHQVKIRGFRIEPGEIEAALRDVAGVREAAVVVRDRRLVAYVVGDVRVEILRQSLRERLPEPMVPSAFVTLPALPLTPSGKVDRKALPASEPQSSEESYVAPRTPVEEILAGIWAEVLGRERVGASDHFFDLGGHSLLATRVMSRLRRAFGVEMPLRDLFETPALADFAARIETALREGTGSTELSLMPALVPVPREGPLPLSFSQQRLWFLYRLEPESAAFRLGSAVRLTGVLLPGALAASLGEIVRRHEVLRTRYREGADGAVQIVDPAAPFLLPVIDLGGLPEGMRERELHLLADREEARPFDLTRSWPLRARLVRLARDEHAILFTLHHIAGDGWSMGLLAREVGVFYARAAGQAAGRAPALPEPPVQYGDYAVWQRGWLSGERLETELDWWRERLRSPLPVLELPQQRERPDTPGFRGAACSVALPAGLRRALAETGRREGATLFMVLLAGLKALLYTYSGQEDLIVGTNVANRDRSEIEGLIGFFVNNLALRTDLSGDPTFRELVRRVRDVTLGAFTHQEVPFEKVLEAVQPRRQTAFAPLFQVLFVLQSFPALSWPVRGQEAALLVGLETRTANFDLTLAMWEAGDGMAGSLTYDTGLFAEAAMPRMAEHFQALLQGVAEDPDQPLSAILLTTEADVQQLASDFNEDS